MKNLKIRIALLTFLAITASAVAAFAQNPSKVESVIKELVDKYETVEGVECIVAAKGSGLELIKMMFNKELGKDFMKGVNKITVIEYTSASQSTCAAVKKDIDVFPTILQEFDMNEIGDSSGNEFVRCFAAPSETNAIADFVMVLEDDSAKMLIYMAGKIVVEP